MTIRRHLLNFGSTSADFRLGCGALDELPRLLPSAVGKPCRALLVADGAEGAERIETVRRALVDGGFAVHDVRVQDAPAAPSLAQASELFAALADAHITADDLVVAVGGAQACTLATFAAALWCAGTPCALVPTTFDAMCTVATELQPLSAGTVPARVELAAHPALVVCDLDIVRELDDDACARGMTAVVAAHLADSRKNWERLPQLVEGLCARREVPLIEALCTTQTSRLATLKSVSPSARQALRYGKVTAAALDACLDGRVPRRLLLAEGMRFEARLAHDACGFAIDDVFAQDDVLADLGVAEPAFALDAKCFLDALRAACLARSNRLMLPLPKHPGTVRLVSVDEGLLERHARAYLASRAEACDGCDA